MTTPKYPHITADLSARDGNAFYILGFVRALLLSHGVPRDEANDFLNEASSGDYDHMLRTVMRWVNVT